VGQTVGGITERVCIYEVVTRFGMEFLSERIRLLEHGVFQEPEGFGGLHGDYANPLSIMQSSFSYARLAHFAL